MNEIVNVLDPKIIELNIDAKNKKVIILTKSGKIQTNFLIIVRLVFNISIEQ